MLSSLFHPKIVSALNGCFPLPRPCLSRGVGVKSPNSIPGTHYNNFWLLFLCIQWSLCFLPSSLLVPQNMSEALGWRIFDLRGYFLPGSSKENVNCSVRQDTVFHEDGAITELLLPLNFAIYQQLNKSYWPQLQQWGLVYNHRTICKQLLQTLERRVYCLMQRPKENQSSGEQKYLSRLTLHWWRSAVLQLWNSGRTFPTMSCRFGAAAQTDTTYPRKGDRAGSGNTSFSILMKSPGMF